MNTLSIMLVLINLIGNLGGLFILFAIFSVLAALISLLVFGITDDHSWDKREELDRKENIRKAAKKWAKTGFISAFVFAFLAAVMPSERTLYMVLGSEIGEKVFNSNDFKSVKDPTLELIRKQLQLKIEQYNEELNKKDKK